MLKRVEVIAVKQKYWKIGREFRPVLKDESRVGMI